MKYTNGSMITTDSIYNLILSCQFKVLQIFIKNLFKKINKKTDCCLVLSLSQRNLSRESSLLNKTILNKIKKKIKEKKIVIKKI